MKLSEVLNLDARQPNSNEVFQAWLRKIPIINKKAKDGQDVSLNLIEELIFKLCKKYKVDIQWIMLSMIDGEIPWYSMSMKSSTNHEWLGTMYGVTIYETYSKTALFLYAYTRKVETHE